METASHAPREARRSKIRRRAVGGSIATFLAVWALIFFEVVSGHDPVLGKQRAARPAATASPATPTVAQPSTTPAPLDPLTTRQS